MVNLLIILLMYGVYLLVVGLFVSLSWYAEKLDPDNDLPPSIWDEILPKRPRSPHPTAKPASGGLLLPVIFNRSLRR